jgi:hypothetical protein
MYTIETPSVDTKKPFTGKREGVFFYEGRAQVENLDQVERFVTYYGYRVVDRPVA